MWPWFSGSIKVMTTISYTFFFFQSSCYIFLQVCDLKFIIWIILALQLEVLDKKEKKVTVVLIQLQGS